MLRRLCVFLGSSSGTDPGYRQAALDLGRLLASRGIGLVYGGGNVGLMGVIADAVLEGGGEVHGVIPAALVDRELAHRGVTELHVVDTMHERKARMADLADGFAALPGGMGTLEELFEALTWAQLGIHRKPIGLLNGNGYFDSLLAFLDRGVSDGFIPARHRELFAVAASPADLLDALAAFTPPRVTAWARKSDR